MRMRRRWQRRRRRKGSQPAWCTSYRAASSSPSSCRRLGICSAQLCAGCQCRCLAQRYGCPHSTKPSAAAAVAACLAERPRAPLPAPCTSGCVPCSQVPGGAAPHSYMGRLPKGWNGGDESLGLCGRFCAHLVLPQRHPHPQFPFFTASVLRQPFLRCSLCVGGCRWLGSAGRGAPARAIPRNLLPALPVLSARRISVARADAPPAQAAQQAWPPVFFSPSWASSLWLPRCV